MLQNHRNVHRLFSLVVFVMALVAGGVKNARSSEMIFNSFGAAGVSNGPTVETTFTLTKPTTISSIVNYHWNNMAGQDPNLVIGWIGIEQIVSGSANVEIGRWPVVGRIGAYGAVNVMWVASPNVLLGAGAYKIIDSDSATWSYTDYPWGGGGEGANWVPGQGMSQVYAATKATDTVPANGAVAVTVKQPLTITFSENVVQGPAWNSITASYINYSGAVPVTVNVPLTKTLSGNVLKITPKGSYGAHAFVTVKIPAGSVADLGVTESVAGILSAAPSGYSQFSFSTAP